ncbi:MAG: hypothetical protein ACFFD2_18620 [Promethearchaeota archaeon]
MKTSPSTNPSPIPKNGIANVINSRLPCSLCWNANALGMGSWCARCVPPTPRSSGR